MRLLVLGHSDSSGNQLPSPSEAWPWILERELPAVIGEPVELAFRRIYASGPGAVRYLEGFLEEQQPDYIVLNLTSHAFSLRFVYARMRRLFGPRGSRLSLALQHRAERTAARFGTAGERTYRVLQGGVRRLVRPLPETPFDVAVESYTAIIRRLAREEETHVTVVSGVSFSRRHHDNKAARGDLIDRFYAILKREALDHHFTWVENEAILRAAGDTERFYLADGVHRNPAGHRVLADALLPVIAASRGPAASRAVSAAAADAAAGT